MHPFTKALIEALKKNKNDDNAFWMSKYMKNKFAFFGIKVPERTALYKMVLAKQGKPAYKDLKTIVKELYGQPQRELHQCAIVLTITYIKKNGDKKLLDLFEWMITENSWWDTVDFLATRGVGEYFKRYPEEIKSRTEKWMQSGNMWLQRVAVLFQLKYKKDTDVELWLGYVMRLKGSKEFFIQKAIGWTLREYSKTDPEFVVNFILGNDLPALSKREGLKWLKDKGKLTEYL